jgi:hypothetical protein
MPRDLTVGSGQSLAYYRLDTAGQRIIFTLSSLDASLNGVPVVVTHSPAWDEEAKEYVIELAPAELAVVGTLVLTFKGAANGKTFEDVERYLVLDDDSTYAGLIYRVSQFLRVDSGDTTVPGLVMAAVAYLAGAGCQRPSEDDAEATSLYETAVMAQTSILYSGGESKLGPTVTSIILQTRDY